MLITISPESRLPSPESPVSLFTFAKDHGKSSLAEQGSQVPVDTQMTLDAAPTLQKPIVSAVLLLKCKKTSMKGTGFLISTGVVITAAHVLCGCEAADLEGTTPLNGTVEFSNPIVRDNNLDLAALVPKEPLHGGLQLAADANPGMGERVNTWGYPLIYNGPAPLLSVGYVSGYYEATEVNFCTSTENPSKSKSKHVVVNGAFNPGNSGGPLFVFGQSKVIGIVVWKSIAFSDQVKVAIEGFHSARGASLGGRFSEKQPDGTYTGISDEEVIARVLEEFYTKVQVNIGEAISVSELNDFLKEHKKELPSL
jgi:S1-C subfamily serine protease